jgi:hypothetical protein
MAKIVFYNQAFAAGYIFHMLALLYLASAFNVSVCVNISFFFIYIYIYLIPDPWEGCWQFPWPLSRRSPNKDKMLAD